MNEHLDNNIRNETYQYYYARISAKGYQSPLISPDDSPFTLAEHLIAFLNAFDEASPPPEVWAERLKKALDALPRIADALEAESDYTDTLKELVDAVREYNRLRAKENPHQSSEEA